jgi:hypothetical protein
MGARRAFAVCNTDQPAGHGDLRVSLRGTQEQALFHRMICIRGTARAAS